MTKPFIETLGMHKGHHSMTSRRVAWCTFEQPCTDVVDHPINTSAQVYRGVNYKVGPPAVITSNLSIFWSIANQLRSNLGLTIGALDCLSLPRWSDNCDINRRL